MRRLTPGTAAISPGYTAQGSEFGVPRRLSKSLRRKWTFPSFLPWVLLYTPKNDNLHENNLHEKT